MKAQLDFTGNQRLLEAMSKISDKSEAVVNQVLRDKGAAEVMAGIIGYMPISNRKKTHAKQSNSLRAVMINLGFEILPRGHFSYLVFPNDGIGRHNRLAQQFFEKGLESRSDRVLELLLAELTQAQEEALSSI